MSMGFSRQEDWSRKPSPSPEDSRTQRLNLGLPHCRWILHHLGHQGSPMLRKMRWSRRAGWLDHTPLVPVRVLSGRNNTSHPTWPLRVSSCPLIHLQALLRFLLGKPPLPAHQAQVNLLCRWSLTAMGSLPPEHHLGVSSYTRNTRTRVLSESKQHIWLLTMSPPAPGECSAGVGAERALAERASVITSHPKLNRGGSAPHSTLHVPAVSVHRRHPAQSTTRESAG